MSLSISILERTFSAFELTLTLDSNEDVAIWLQIYIAM